MSTILFPSPKRAGYEIRINTGTQPLAKALKFSAVAPAGFLQTLKPEDDLTIFVQIYQDGGEETLDSFEPVDAVLDKGRIHFELLPAYFTPLRTQDGSWEAIFIIGSVGANATS